jgi:hypothetical protein
MSCTCVHDRRDYPEGALASYRVLGYKDYMTAVWFSAIVILFLWLMILVWNPPARVAQRWFDVNRGDLVAGGVACVWSAVVFLVMTSQARSPSEVQLPWRMMVSAIIFLALGGSLSAWASRGRTFLVPTSIAIQVVTVAVIAVAPFGFDHRSSWGLDAGHLIALLAIYSSALAGGLLAAITSRWRRAAWLQLGMLGVPAAAIFVGAIAKGEL